MWTVGGGGGELTKTVHLSFHWKTLVSFTITPYGSPIGRVVVTGSLQDSLAIGSSTSYVLYETRVEVDQFLQKCLTAAE